MVQIKNLVFSNANTNLYTCPAGKRAKVIIKHLHFRSSARITIGAVTYGNISNVVTRPYSNMVPGYLMLYDNNNNKIEIPSTYGNVDCIPSEHFLDENQSITAHYCDGYIVVVEEDK